MTGSARLRLGVRLANLVMNLRLADFVRTASNRKSASLKALKNLELAGD